MTKIDSSNNDTQTTSRLYRYRTIDALIGERQELKNLEIFFSAPDNLNDPMEGYTNFHWHGDHIVWTNFFKHYLFILQSYYLKIVNGLHPTLNLNETPVEQSKDRLELFENAWNLFSSHGVINYINHISENSFRIYPQELISLLRNFHFYALDSILKSFQQADLPNLAPMLKLEEIVSKPLPEADLFFTFKRFEHPQTEEAHSLFNNLMEQSALFQAYKNRNKKLDDAVTILYFDFPKEYVKQFQSLVFPKIYSASFVSEFSSPTMWGHYAKSHTGACLIFETTLNQKERALSIRSPASPSQMMNFTEVVYTGEYPELNAFQNLGRLSQNALRYFWYRGENDNLSNCAHDLLFNREEYSNKYWDSIPRNHSIKQKDWEYEKEHRLILTGAGMDIFKPAISRKFKYDFSSLKGIIFGIRTTTQDKIKIMEVIEGLCLKNQKTDFDFFQAYQSPISGNIKIHKLSMFGLKL